MPKTVATENQWLDAGLALFAVGGIDALVVERMAHSLSCSKSSFYWYFKDREAFLDTMIRRWIDRATTSVIVGSEQEPAAESKIRSLLAVMFEDKNSKNTMFHLRQLGASRIAYEQMLDEVEKTRIRYMTSLLLQLQFDEVSAREKAEMIYDYYLGWYERNKLTEASENEAAEQVRLVWTHLVGKKE